MSNSELVYSTEFNNTCPKCNKPLKKCVCKKQNAQQKKDGIVRVGRETKGRKGKGVTTVSGLPIQLDDIKDVAKVLKQKCGSGGTVKDAVIEIQGDHRDVVMEELAKQGFTVKRSGG